MSRHIHPSPLVVFLLGIAVPAALYGQEEVEPMLEHEAYEVGLAEPPTDESTIMVSLTLQEAIQRALETNLDIQSARLNPEIQSYAWASARAAFNPSLNITTGYNSSVNQSTTQLDGGDRITTDAERNLIDKIPSWSELEWTGEEEEADLNDLLSVLNLDEEVVTAVDLDSFWEEALNDRPKPQPTGLSYEDAVKQGLITPNNGDE